MENDGKKASGHSNKIESSFEDHPLQRRALGDSDSGSMLPPPPFQLNAGTEKPDDNSNTAKSNPNGLPGQLKAGIEQMSGIDMSDVTVHRNSDKPAQMQAHAYAQGSDIHLGPGQEKHLPHEAWHVVQQKEGRVKANTSVNGTAVNNDVSLEGEADSMGAKAMQMKAENAYQSGGLATRNALRTVQMKSAVVQRVVNTHGGEWKTPVYHEVDTNNDPTAVNDDMTGVKVELEFHPGANVDARQIGLLQSVNSIQEGSPISLSETVESRSIPEGEDGHGLHIDQASSNRNPLYAVEAPPATDTELTDTGADAGWGQHAWRYKDAAGAEQIQKGILKDTPNLRTHNKNSKQIFESTALAIEGNQKDTYYGSVEWGWETDDEGNFSKLPLTVKSQGVPTDRFMRAGELWNENPTSSGDSTLNLPLHSIYVVQAAVTLRGSDGGSTELPVGTRVILKNWNQMMGNNVLVEVGDGEHTGLTGTVYQGNLVDERTGSFPPLGPGVPESGGGDHGNGTAIV